MVASDYILLVRYILYLSFSAGHLLFLHFLDVAAPCLYDLLFATLGWNDSLSVIKTFINHPALERA
jgi:hypothetical protein